MKNIFFLVLPALAFFACQAPKVPQNRSFHGYVRYLADQAQLRAEATLRGQDSLPMAPPGGIRFQSQEMSAAPVQGPGYRYQRNGAAETSGVFDWTDEAGQRHHFTLPLVPVDNFSFGSKTISRQHPDTLRWAGAPLEKGETMVLMWQNLATGQTVPMEIYGTAALATIEFPAAKLAEVPPGRWSLYLVRKKLVKSDAGGVTATGISEYYTRADTVTVR